MKHIAMLINAKDVIATIRPEIYGHFDAHEAYARILTADTHAFNDFDHPEDVTIQPWTAQVENGKLQVKLPPCSVVAVAVK